MLLVNTLLACSTSTIKLGGEDTAYSDNGGTNGGDNGGTNGGDTEGTNGGDSGGDNGGGNGGGNGGDNGGSSDNAAAGTYLATMSLYVPDYEYTLCTDDFLVEVSTTGALSAEADCSGDSGYGGSFSIPVTFLGAVSDAGDISGSAALSLDMGGGGGGSVDIEAELTGSARSGALVIAFPFTVEFGRDPVDVEGSVVGEIR